MIPLQLLCQSQKVFLLSSHSFQDEKSCNIEWFGFEARFLGNRKYRCGQWNIHIFDTRRDNKKGVDDCQDMTLKLPEKSSVRTKYQKVACTYNKIIILMIEV